MSTKSTVHSMIVTFLLLAAAMILPQGIEAAAGSAIVCAPSQSCEVGEFLYDDEYTPITTASCTFTSRYPNGTLLHNGVALSSETDGWYSHSFTTPATEGLYRAQICCTAGTDYLCIDKGFEVQGYVDFDADSIAAAVWSYSSRTVTSFSSVAADVWSYSTRLLTGTTLSDGGKLATKSDVTTVEDKVNGIEDTVDDIETDTTSIQTTVNNTNSQISQYSTTTASSNADLEELKKTTKETRLLLEQVVNKPIIETVIEQAEPDLRTKLEDSLLTANGLYLDTRLVNSRITKLSAEWNTLSPQRRLSLVNEIAAVVGVTEDTDSDISMVGSAYWVKSQWTQQTAQDLFDNAILLSSAVTNLQQRMATKQVGVQDLNVLKRHNDQLTILVGDIADEPGTTSYYGTLASVFELAYALDGVNGEIEELLAQWNIREVQYKQRTLRDLQTRLTALNSIPHATAVLSTTNQIINSSDKNLRNAVFSMQGLIKANKKFLAMTADNPIATTWLEVGSIVFKTLITNPSKIVKQNAELKYYLPAELKEEHILEVDDRVEIKYDPEKGQYYVSGYFDLDPGETITVSTRTQDIWEISEDEIESLKKQAEDLAAPLEKTSYFAQSVTLKSDIIASLDKILIKQKEALTPEAKVRAYRESVIEMNAVKEKMEKLKELVTEAQSSSTLFGFVGATQTIAVWGMIIIIGAGFLFLTFYMKKIAEEKHGEKSHEEDEIEERPEESAQAVEHVQEEKIKPRFHISPTSTIIFFAITGFTALVIIFLVTAFSGNKETKTEPVEEISMKTETSVLGESNTTSEANNISSDNDQLTNTLDDTTDQNSITDAYGFLQEVSIDADGTLGIKMYKNASLNAEVIRVIDSDTIAQSAGVDGDWVHVVFESEGTTFDGWVHVHFVTPLDGNTLLKVGEKPTNTATTYSSNTGEAQQQY